MHLRPLPAEEPDVLRYIEELWIPYNRDLAAVVEGHALADDVDVDIVAEELEFRLDRLESEGYRAWVAVDGPDDGDPPDDSNAADAVAEPDAGDIADAAGDLAGFITTELEEAPSVFERPDRLIVGDVYVSEPYRGGGLAGTLMDRAAECARAEGCGEVVLDVDVGNERAIAFYEKRGFEPFRHRMAVDADAL